LPHTDTGADRTADTDAAFGRADAVTFSDTDADHSATVAARRRADAELSWQGKADADAHHEPEVPRSEGDVAARSLATHVRHSRPRTHGTA
jgi:hypothetical protein